MRIQPESDLEAYSQIPIAYQIDSRVDLQALIKENKIVEIPTTPRWKDYDLSPQDHPTALAPKLAKGAIFAAFEGDQRLGGAIVAREVPGYREPADTAILLDIRVRPDARGKGIGQALFQAALAWAKPHPLVVETQNTNVAACRFYQKMGFTLREADPTGYGPDIDEAKLIWQTQSVR